MYTKQHNNCEYCPVSLLIVRQVTMMSLCVEAITSIQILAKSFCRMCRWTSSAEGRFLHKLLLFLLHLFVCLFICCICLFDCLSELKGVPVQVEVLTLLQQRDSRQGGFLLPHKPPTVNFCTHCRPVLQCFLFQDFAS